MFLFYLYTSSCYIYVAGNILRHRAASAEAELFIGQHAGLGVSSWTHSLPVPAASSAGTCKGSEGKCMWEEGGTGGGQKGDRMLVANISCLDLPKPCWRSWCLHLCSKGWQALHCVTLLHPRLTFGAMAAWKGQLRRSNVLWGGTFLFHNRPAAASLLSKILEWYLGLDQGYLSKPRPGVSQQGVQRLLLFNYGNHHRFGTIQFNNHSSGTDTFPFVTTCFYTSS